MAHEIEINEVTGRREIAWVGDKPWHGLGSELPQDASIEVWAEMAGMQWTAQGSPVQYSTPDGHKVFTDKQVIYRSDTNKALSVVGEKFKIVQPLEILEFFRDLIQIHQMQLSVAGCLFNGRRFWATAETGKAAEILPQDQVRGQLLLMTSLDGTLATTAKFVSTRVVCNNTMQIAMGEKGGMEIRKTHRQVFDPTQVKIDLGLLDGAWQEYINNMKNLTKVKMSDDKAAKFFMDLVARNDELVPDAEISRTTKNTVEELMYRLRNGLGADSGRGTAWNVLNAVTEKYTHGSARRNQDHQFVNSLYGTDSNIKIQAMDMLLAA